MEHVRLDISPIDRQLFIAARPQSGDAPEVIARGVRLVLNMIPTPTPSGLRSAPLQAVWLPWLDTARLPLPIWLLRRGTQAAVEALQRGEGVLTYCREGRHRSVAMACAILVAHGMTAEQAMARVKEARPVADPEAAHVAAVVRKFEAFWNDGHRGRP